MAPLLKIAESENIASVPPSMAQELKSSRDEEVEQVSTERPAGGDRASAEAQTSTPPQTAPPSPSPPAAVAEEATTMVNASASPKVKWRVEYRQQYDDTLLYTRDVLNKSASGTKQQQKPHTGPVFEVIDVNYTAETKDTDKATQKSAEEGSPSLSFAGRQFVRIHSPSVINALQSVVNYYPRHPVIGDPIDIYEPYPILVHHQAELEAFRERFSPEALQKDDEETKDCVLKDTYEHLGYLLDFLNDCHGNKITLEKERWVQPVPKVSFDLLWLLLKPGTDVYCDSDNLGSREPYIVSHVYIAIYNKAVFEYTVRVWQLSGDEYYIHPKEREFTIRRFDGERAIHKLDVFPCEYLPNHAERKAALIERGKLFFKLRRKKCMYFDGECSTFPRRTYKGYVMCDPVQYAMDFAVVRDDDGGDIVDRKPSGSPYCLCERCANMETEAKKPAKFDGYMRIDPDKVDTMLPHQYFICARDTYAFIFHIREWKRLFLDGFHEPQWDGGLIDNLVLKPHYKSMIQGLSKNFMEQKTSAPVNSHDALSGNDGEANQSWSADFIENKGKGLIFLLHGKPGVGKTYTAECIAEHVRRPLLPITCADIGVNPSEVEGNLVRWFKMARSWDAVMLLDEADIYMEYRQIHDLNRNNLVASFLRAIEYYEGILFLTTNRVGTFDEAFLSRINLAIYYPDFQNEERQRIWHNYFDKLEREAGDRFHVPEGTKEYATESDAVSDLKWNGREIRNAFQIAVSLAQAEGTKDKKGRFTVKRDHIKVTVELSKEFKNYMVSVHKKNESQRAMLMGYRYDAFNAPNAPSGAKQEFY